MWILHPDIDRDVNFPGTDTPIIGNYAFQPDATIVEEGGSVTLLEKVFGVWGWWWWFPGDEGEPFVEIALPGGSTARMEWETPIKNSVLWKVAVTLETPAGNTTKTFVSCTDDWQNVTFAAGIYLADDGTIRAYVWVSDQHPFAGEYRFVFGGGLLHATAATGQSFDDLAGTVSVTTPAGMPYLASPRFFHLDLLRGEVPAIPDGKTPSQRWDSTLGCIREPLEAWLGATYSANNIGNDTASIPSGYYQIGLLGRERQGAIFDYGTLQMGERIASNSGSPLAEAVFTHEGPSNISHDTTVNGRMSELTVTLAGTAIVLSQDGLGFNQYQGEGSVLSSEVKVHADVRRRVTYVEPTLNNISQVDTYSVSLNVATLDYDGSLEPRPGWAFVRFLTLTNDQATNLLAGNVVTLATAYTSPTNEAVTIAVQATG